MAIISRLILVFCQIFLVIVVAVFINISLSLKKLRQSLRILERFLKFVACYPCQSSQYWTIIIPFMVHYYLFDVFVS